jgi:hypothetical protein
VKQRSSTWSSTLTLTARMGAVLLVTSALGGVVSCSKKKKEADAKAQAEKAEAERRLKPQGDRYEDGQRLAAALRDWTRRWNDTPDLPTCDPLLKGSADLELCKTGATALTTMKAAVVKPEPEAVLIHDAAELAFTTEAASEKLRNASMEKMQAEHNATPVGSASGAAKAPPAPAFSTLPKARPLGSAGKAALADKLKGVETAPLDPAMQVMQAYSRVNRAALRYLSQFLQFGPLPTRKATFSELEALSKRKETWPALGRTLREAAMAENDPELQGKLKTLGPTLSRRPAITTPAAPGTSPPELATPAPPSAP